MKKLLAIATLCLALVLGSYPALAGEPPKLCYSYEVTQGGGQVEMLLPPNTHEAGADIHLYSYFLMGGFGELVAVGSCQGDLVPSCDMQGVGYATDRLVTDRGFSTSTEPIKTKVHVTLSGDREEGKLQIEQFWGDSVVKMHKTECKQS